MIPGLNPRKMQGMMKQLGMSQEQIDAEEVIIKCKDKNIVIKEPGVSRIKFQGQDMFQISGRIEEESKEEGIKEEDIKTVMAQADTNEEKAREALEKSGGDLAAAIMELKD